MSAQKKVLFEIRSPKTDVNEWIIGDVHYNIGGMNYFSGSSYPRGYYFSVGPIERGEHFTSYKAFSAPTVLVAQAKRFSAKELSTILPDAQTVERLIGQVWFKTKEEARHVNV